MPPPIPYLESNFQRARPILFTGAGFSLSAKNVLGKSIPSYGELSGALWELCFPGTPVDPASNLQNIFESAHLQRATELKSYLSDALRVDAMTLPVWYRKIFSLPWYRIYTLNIDDLELAVQRQFDLPREILSVSGTAPKPPPSSGLGKLQVIHLNGTLEDIPDNITFSSSQYGERLSRQEPVYVQLTADLVSHPFVFIGTKLDEPPLWQHMQLRAARGGRKIQELRPHSFLVSPTLDKPREAVLSQYNISWIAATGELFVSDIIDKLGAEAQEGFKVLKEVVRARSASVQIPNVTDLTKFSNQKTEFLLGAEPIWSDLQSGRAILRESDSVAIDTLRRTLAKPGLKGCFLFTGTAGAGKSTALMRAALTLSNDGKSVGWIDRESELSPRDIRQAFDQPNFPEVLAIDDADVYGAELASLVREIVAGGKRTLMMVAVRATKVEACLKGTSLKGVPLEELIMPPLADADIEQLLESLERENRLGALKALQIGERKKVMSEKAGRQLLVAMIEATSGRRFEEKAFDELGEMDPSTKRVYALVTTATALGFSITKHELLIALGDASNVSLDVLDRLVKRHVIEPTQGNANTFRARHRVIAEIIFNKMQGDGQLYETLLGLAFSVATQISAGLPSSSRPHRLLIRLLNHDFLHRCFAMSQARQFYEELEAVLKGQHHFWLQRGSLELEDGYLQLAQNFLDQAQALNPDDPLVSCTYSHLLFRRALNNVSALDAQTFVDQAIVQLKGDIIRRGDKNHHSYHILGSQILAWIRRGPQSFDEKKALLEDLEPIMKEGASRHPRSEIVALKNAVHDEYLNLAIRH